MNNIDTIYYNLNERQLKRIYEPGEGLFVCESLKVIRRALDAGYKPESFLIEKGKEKEISDLPLDDYVPINVVPHKKMREISGYALTGGILSAMHRRRLPSIEDLCESAHRLVILDDIENPTNTGAIFRCAAALGMDGVILTKGCTDPLYRRCARVSMGTVFQIPWTFAEQEDEALIDTLRDIGFKSAALALADDSVSLESCGLEREDRLAVILGNEDHGISEGIISSSDAVIKIPMSNGVDSLNVGAAAAVAFWALGRPDA